MPQRGKSIIALYPGSFDPVTYGHLDVIRRASLLLNELIVGVGENPAKASWFTQEERIAMLRPHVTDLGNVRVEGYSGLTVDFVRTSGANVLLRGIRNQVDLSEELQQANINLVVGGIETFFLSTNEQYVLTSSTYIKQIYELGGRDLERISRLVPPNVIERLEQKMKQNNNRPAGADRE